MKLSRIALVALLSAAAPLAAETAPEPPRATHSVTDLGQVLQLDGLFEVLREEGLAHGRSIEADMFPGRGGPQWEATVARIYDPDRLKREFEDALSQALSADGETVRAATDFFATALGQRIVAQEIDARRAFLDTAAEEAARVAADDAAAARDPKVALIRRMIEACDLVERNVAGSMSNSLAFLTGLAASGPRQGIMTQDHILGEVESQEDQIRSDSSTWLHAYLGLAYRDLTEEELQAYVAFWESPAGERLNSAIFLAYDRVFRRVSRDLGEAAGEAMQRRDI